MKYLILAAAAALSFGGMAQAATWNVYENNAPSGDYADALGAAGNQLGANPSGFDTVTLVGDLGCSVGFSSCGSGVGNDAVDAFYFDVAAGTLLTELTLSTEGSGGVSLLAELYDTFDSSQVFSISALTNQTVTLLSLFDAPLGEGNYNFALSLVSGPESGLDVSYTLNATYVEVASAVPLPASLPLLLAGFGGFAALRRRKAR